LEVLYFAVCLTGVLGIGFSLLIPPAELTQHVQKIRREGFPEYLVKPHGERNVYSSVIYIQPFSGSNLRFFGYDMLSEPIRRAAMEQARDTNEAVLSGKVDLFRGAGDDAQAGTLMFFPVYHKGMPIESVEQRRAAIRGWVFNSSRMNELMQGQLIDISLEEAKTLHFQVFDGVQPSTQTLLYECHPPGDQKHVADVHFTRQVPFVFNGHRWTMSFTKTGSGFFSADHALVWIVLVSGIVSTLLLFLLVRALLIIRTEAESIAERLTLDLRRRKRFIIEIINSLPSNIAVLDTDGVIVLVNESWQNFALENGSTTTPAGDLGKQYLDVFNTIDEGKDHTGVEEAREGLHAVLSGEQGKFSLEYPCLSPDEQRWFLMSVSRLSGSQQGVVISHTDITSRKLAELELQKVLNNLDKRVRERTNELTMANVQLMHEIEEREKIKESLQVAYTEINDLKDRLQAENIYLEKEVARYHNFGDFIGQSKCLALLFERIRQVAPMNATVLVLGETGTGKGVVARAIHSHSDRKNHSMITVNCTALPANLIESELFGRERGAFTGATARQMGRFELANGGTIFLDEIGEMPLELQSKLLRVIQDGEFELVGSPRTIKVDVRIIAATNRNLEEEIRSGRFREDLFYRLNVFPLTIPPLRERKEDIPLLVNHFVAKFNKKNSKNIETVTRDTLYTLQEYQWPGNVRELESIIERAVIISSGTELQVLERFDTFRKAEEPEGKEIKAISELERDHILQVLQQTGWRINGTKGAAVILGLNPNTLRSRMRKLNIVRQ
jgi:transcriptional regulator with GAF, ATPase, and Fis domain/PAS domain-containing protein